MKQRGIDLTVGRAEHLCMQLRMRDLVSSDITIVDASASLSEISAALKKGAPVYVGGKDDKKFRGSITLEDLQGAENKDVQAEDLAHSVPVMQESDNLTIAIAMTGSHEVGAFPILSEHEDQRVIGFVSVKKIMNAYQGVLDRIVREDHSFLE
jgi:predicted transcriptional regulator